jgi:hypothetical protein
MGRIFPIHEEEGLGSFLELTKVCMCVCVSAHVSTEWLVFSTLEFSSAVLLAASFD